jgi:pSer/pThr/pTyr-binding forkhead associated (FHA) protein
MMMVGSIDDDPSLRGALQTVRGSRAGTLQDLRGARAQDRDTAPARGWPGPCYPSTESRTGERSVMKKCSKCGYNNQDKASFCDLCTRKLDTPTLRLEPRPPAPAGAGPVTRSFAEFDGVSFSASAPAPDPKLAVERRYFVLPTGVPFLLERGAKVEIGRDDASKLMLSTPRVSRHHAEVRWFGSQCCICDLGSQNGVAVNRERLTSNGKRELKDKDEVEIGGVPLSFRVLPPGVPETELVRHGNETEADVLAPKREDLVGQMRLVPLDAILKRLEELAASGTLAVESGGTTGTLVLKDGKAVYGSYRDERGDAAVKTISRLKDGRFRFEQTA